MMTTKNRQQIVSAHSRTVDEITRKEGEAAILWFEKVLGP